MADKGVILEEQTGTNQYVCLKKAIESDVKIVIGTDFLGWEDMALNITEFTTLVRLGMSPMKALKAGTSLAAECLRWEKKLGTIRSGLLADIIAVPVPLTPLILEGSTPCPRQP